MENLFGFLWIVMLGGSVWGAVVLAMKWAKNVWARLAIGIALCAVFWAAGTVAVIAGCVQVAGSSFH